MTNELRAEFGPITRTDIVRYAGAGGDFNPVHHDDDYARGLGHPSAFAMGLLTVGYLATAIERWFGRDAVQSLTTKFVSPVWPGETLVCTGAAEADGAIQVRVSNEADEAKVLGRVVLTGRGSR